MNDKKPTLLGVVTGPILLILLGGLFLAAQNTPYTFSRTWPVLLIVLGALKLLERMTDRPAGGKS